MSTAKSKRMRSWDRQLWGVRFTAGRHDDRPLMIGTRWNPDTRGMGYEGEPTRVLLFTTRRIARAWCSARHAQYSGRHDNCARWRFTPVRVRETVREVVK